jgi:Mor family transcriptional regulator
MTMKQQTMSSAAKGRPQRQPEEPSLPWEEMTDDIIVDVLRRVLELAPAFTQALADQVDREIRSRWAGDAPYISARAGDGRSRRNEAIRRDYRSGERTGLLCRRYGLTPRQIQRILAAAE